MSLQKAGGTNIDNTVTPASASALVDHLETYLVSAGWSIISGAGTDNIKFQSAATTAGMQIRVITNVSGSVVTLELKNVSETAAASSHYVRANVNGSDTWRFMANKFAFVMFQDTTAPNYNNANGGKWVLCATLHIETFQEAGTSEVGILTGDHANNSNTVRNSFRTLSNLYQAPGVTHLLYNGAIVDLYDGPTSIYPGMPAFYLPVPDLSQQYTGNPNKLSQFSSGEYAFADPFIGWGAPAYTDMKKIKGQLFDVIIMMDPNLTRGQEVTVGSDVFRVVNDPSGSAALHPFAICWLEPAA